jgi:hypothetical protein
MTLVSKAVIESEGVSSNDEDKAAKAEKNENV